MAPLNRTFNVSVLYLSLMIEQNWNRKINKEYIFSLFFLAEPNHFLTSYLDDFSIKGAVQKKSYILSGPLRLLAIPHPPRTFLSAYFSTDISAKNASLIFDGSPFLNQKEEKNNFLPILYCRNVFWGWGLLYSNFKAPHKPHRNKLKIRFSSPISITVYVPFALLSIAYSKQNIIFFLL